MIAYAIFVCRKDRLPMPEIGREQKPPGETRGIIRIMGPVAMPWAGAIKLRGESMETTKMIIDVNQEEAIRQGKNRYGIIAIDIDPADLTPEQRETLATCGKANIRDIPGFPPYPQNDFSGPADKYPAVGEATTETAKYILDWTAEKKRQIAAAKKQEHEANVQKALACPATEYIVFRQLARIGERYRYTLPIDVYHDVDKKALESDPRLSDRMAEVKNEIDRLNAEDVERDVAEKAEQDRIARERIIADTREAIAKGAEELERVVANRYIYDRNESTWRNNAGEFPEADEFIAMIDAAKENRERHIAEKEAAKKQQIADYIAANGTDNQKKRSALNLLPDDEVLNMMRDEAFAPLADFPRYEKLTASDVPCWCDDYDEDAPDANFSNSLADEATAEEFDSMEKFTALMPGAVVTLRVHRGWCTKCETPDGEDGNIERKSIRVAVTVGAFDFSREYAV
jgi:hypothetical protein